jgi:hypothetical protein
MDMQVQPETFTKAELATDAGVMRLNDWIRRVYSQFLIVTGTANGVIKPGTNIDLEGKYRILNSKP